MPRIAARHRDLEGRVRLRHRGRQTQVEEGLRGLAVDRDHAVAGAQAVRHAFVERGRAHRRGVGDDRADRRRREPHAGEEGDQEQHDREHEVRRDAGEDHDAASKDAGLGEAVRIVAHGRRVAVLLPEHAHIAADRQRAQRVLGLAEAERGELMLAHLDRTPPVLAHDDRIGRPEHESDAAPVAHEAGAHADREAVGADTRPLRCKEMPELMDEDQEAEAEQDEDEAGNSAHESL